MQLIKKVGKGQTFPTHTHMFIIPALFLISLLIYGKDPNLGHSYTFIVCGIMAISFMMRNTALSIFGIYLSCWFAFLLSCGFRELIPQEILVQSLDGTLFVIMGMAFYIVVRNSTGKLESYMNGICILTIVLTALAFIQYFVGHGHPGATLGNRNFYAAFVAISFPMFFRKKWLYFIPALILGLIIAKTSTAIAATLIATGFYFYGWKGAALSTAPAIAYYLIFKMSVHTLSLGARLDYWADALTKMSSSWHTAIFGVGPGVYWQFQNGLHSEIVYLAFNFGIIGITIITVFIINRLTTVKNRILYASFLAICVDSIGNHVMHIIPTALLAIIIFALMDRDNDKEDAQ